MDKKYKKYKEKYLNRIYGGVPATLAAEALEPAKPAEEAIAPATPVEEARASATPAEEASAPAMLAEEKDDEEPLYRGPSNEVQLDQMQLIIPTIMTEISTCIGLKYKVSYKVIETNGLIILIENPLLPTKKREIGHLTFHDGTKKTSTSNVQIGSEDSSVRGIHYRTKDPNQFFNLKFDYTGNFTFVMKDESGSVTVPALSTNIMKCILQVLNNHRTEILP
jgi:hypothetical protein